MSDIENEDGFSEGPLSSIIENDSGQPFNEWIVTSDGTVEGWWGEGYVFHTVEPFLVFKWGFTTKEENQAMSGGFGFDNGQFLSVLLINNSSNSDMDEDFQKYIPSAVLAAVQKTHILDQDNDPHRQLAIALMCIKEEDGVESLIDVLAVSLAATCKTLEGNKSSEVSVNQEFVSADITVNIKG